MRFLPIVGRELRVAARRPSTFRVRFLGALLATLLGGLFLLGSLAPGVGRNNGAKLFQVLSFLCFGAALAAGALLTADCLSREKREGTLGFLFLTDLNGFDVVAGKFVALGLLPLHALLAVFPVAAMTIFLGGVTVAEFWRTVLLVLNSLFLSLATGLWVSSLADDERQAVGFTALALAVLTGAPEVVGWVIGQTPFAAQGSWIQLASPSAALRLSLGTTSPTAPPGFWAALLYQHGLAWLLLITAAGVVRHAWHTGDSGKSTAPAPERSEGRAGETRRPLARVRARHRERLAAAGPIALLAWQGSWARQGVWWVALPAAGATLVLFGLQAWRHPTAGMAEATNWPISVGFFALKLLLAVHAVYFLQDACRSGTMELVLTTPISSRVLRHGHFAAMRHLFTWPMVLLGTLQVLLGVLGTLLAGGDWPSLPIQLLAGLGPPLISGVVHGVDLLAVAYHASRQALRHDRPAKALVHSAVVAVLLPSVFCGYGRLFVDLVIIGQCSPALERFRELVRGWYFPRATDEAFGAPRTG